MPDDYEPEKPNGLWTKWYILGTDGYGSDHVINFVDQRVYVVTASGQLEHYEDLAAKCASVEAWMKHIDDTRGWDNRKYGRSLLDGLVEGLEGAA